LGYEIGKPATSSVSPVTPTLPLTNPPIYDLCPVDIPIKGEFECPPSDDDFPLWTAPKLAETMYSKKCLPLCTPSPRQKNKHKYPKYKAPKVLVGEERSPQLRALLEEMGHKRVPYHWSGGEGRFTKKPCIYFTYESDNSANFSLPKIHFTVDKIANNPWAMNTIGKYFNYSKRAHSECNKWILVEGEE